MSAVLNVNAYRQVAREGVSEEKLLVLGLDGVLEYLRRAKAALAAGALDRKVESMDKARQIVEHLLVALPAADAADAADASSLGSRLEGIYRYLLERLAHANIFDDVQAMDDCAAVVTALRESWLEGLRRA